MAGPTQWYCFSCQPSHAHHHILCTTEPTQQQYCFSCYSLFHAHVHTFTFRHQYKGKASVAAYPSSARRYILLKTAQRHLFFSCYPSYPQRDTFYAIKPTQRFCFRCYPHHAHHHILPMSEPTKGFSIIIATHPIYSRRNICDLRRASPKRSCTASPRVAPASRAPVSPRGKARDAKNAGTDNERATNRST